MRHTLTSYLRLCCVLVLVAGTLLPKMSAAILTHLPGVQSFVICTGGALITITLDASGEPIEMATTDSAPCTLAEAGDPISRPAPLWVAMTLINLPPADVSENPMHARDRLLLQQPQRGPPALA